MTKEELEKEAEDFLQKKWGTSKMLILGGDASEVLADFAEPREVQIARLKYELDREHTTRCCIETDLNMKISVLEQENAELKQAKEGKVVEHFEAYGQCRDSRRIAELEKQIEKMKCCDNCQHCGCGSCDEAGNCICDDCNEETLSEWECIL